MNNLSKLSVLDINSNKIEELPAFEQQSLQKLMLHGNRFTSFNRSVGQLANLDEFSLEWFLYAKPPKLRHAIKADQGLIFTSLQRLSSLLEKHNKMEIEVLTFLENYSDSMFDVNSQDNRSRTPLHNCAVKGDLGVVKGLL